MLIAFYLYQIGEGPHESCNSPSFLGIVSFHSFVSLLCFPSLSPKMFQFKQKCCTTRNIYYIGTCENIDFRTAQPHIWRKGESILVYTEVHRKKWNCFVLQSSQACRDAQCEYKCKKGELCSSISWLPAQMLSSLWFCSWTCPIYWIFFFQTKQKFAAKERSLLPGHCRYFLSGFSRL